MFHLRYCSQRIYFLLYDILIAINSFVLLMDTYHVAMEVGSDYYALFR